MDGDFVPNTIAYDSTRHDSTRPPSLSDEERSLWAPGDRGDKELPGTADRGAGQSLFFKARG
jgi:hypothetical protein